MRKRLFSNATIGGLLLAFLVICAILGAVWTPFDPLRIHFPTRLHPPGGVHLLGTDEFGRDELSRLLSGAATSFLIASLTVFFAIVLGCTIGLLAGFARGWADRIIMTFNNAMLAFPGLLLALGLLTIVGPNQYGIVLALCLAYTPSVVRVVRGAVMSLREREFVESSRVLGNSDLYTMFRHVLPNCIAPISVLATSMFGWVILAESALSFLGLGVPPPAPTWGNMLASARPFISQASYLSIFPGLCIALTLLAINLAGDAVRDRLDPRMRGMK